MRALGSYNCSITDIDKALPGATQKRGTTEWRNCGTAEITSNPKRRNKIIIKTKHIRRKKKINSYSHLPTRFFSFRFWRIFCVAFSRSCLQALAPISARSGLYDINFDLCLSLSVWQFFHIPTLRPLPKDTEGHCKRRLQRFTFLLQLIFLLLIFSVTSP